jgi:hypothetical protein
MRKMARMLLTVSTGLLLAAPLLADTPKEPQMTPEQKAEMETYMKAATPGPQHQFLASTVGNYDLKVKSWPAPGAPPMEETGTAMRKMTLGGRVLVEEVNGTMMGKPFAGQGTTGFDNVSGKYWGTWMDSMGTGVMITEGTCDAQKSCTFHGSWNDPVKKGPVKSRMTTRWTSPTVEVFEMYGPDKTGKEMKMMEITYTKK